MADLAARIRAGVAQATAARQATFLDTCTVTRPADVGQTPVLDADGNAITSPDATVYSGPCSLSHYRSSGVRATVRVTSDNDDAVAEPLTLKLPLDADVRIGDIAQITTSALSPTLAGQQFRVLHEDPRSYTTFRSVTVRGFSTDEP